MSLNHEEKKKVLDQFLDEVKTKGTDHCYVSIVFSEEDDDKPIAYQTLYYDGHSFTTSIAGYDQIDEVFYLNGVYYNRRAERVVEDLTKYLTDKGLKFKYYFGEPRIIYSCMQNTLEGKDCD